MSDKPRELKETVINVLETLNGYAPEALRTIGELLAENEQLQQKLSIAKEALSYYKTQGVLIPYDATKDNPYQIDDYGRVAYEAIAKIESDEA